MDTIPLMSSQLAMLTDADSCGEGYYNSHALIHLYEHVDIQWLQLCIKAVFRDFFLLNSSIVLDRGELCFQVHKGVRHTIAYSDISQVEDREAILDQLICEQKKRPFELKAAPLIRVACVKLDKKHFILSVCYHHVLLCAPSAFKIVERLFSCYDKISESQQPESFSDYKRLVERACAPDLTVWSEIVRCQSYSSFPYYYGKPLDSKNNIHSTSYTLSLDDIGRLRHLAFQHKITLSMLFQAALALTIKLFSADDAVVFGVTRSFKTTETRGLTGLFINTLPFFLELSGPMTLKSLFQDIKNHTKLIKKSLYGSLSGISKATNNAFSGKLDVVIDFKELTLIDLLRKGNDNFSHRDLTFTTDTGHALLIEVIGSGESFVVKFNYDERRISHDYIQSIKEVYSDMLDKTLHVSSELSLSSILLETGSSSLFGEKIDAYLNQSLPECSFKSLTNAGSSFFIRDSSGSYASTAILEKTYSIIRFLENKFPKRAAIIAIFLPRGVDFYACVLAIASTGNIYLPLSINYPSAQLAFMLDDSSAQCILSSREFIALNFFNSDKVSLLSIVDVQTLDSDPIPFSYRFNDHERQSAFYIMYTSGSTGLPKGAVNTCVGVANRILWMKHYFNTQSSDIILHKTPLSFDVSQWEVWLPLISGASVVIAKSGSETNLPYLVSLIQTEKITIVHFVPSVLELMLDNSVSAHDCSSLRLVICSGEALSASLVKAFQHKFSAEIYNLYGPTEAAIDVTAHRCMREPYLNGVPIGAPISNVELRVLSKDNRPVPKYGVGFLHIGPVAGGLGYVSDKLTDAGGFYNTGDLVRVVDGEELVYVGRFDKQVKINGQRLDLSQLDTLLLNFPGIEQSKSCYLATKKILASFVVLENNKQLNQNALKGYLEKHLITAFVPKRFFVLDLIPLTQNGKCDEKRLISILLADKSHESSEKIRGDDEILEVLQCLLDENGINTSDYQQSWDILGVDSILMMKLALQLSSKFSITLSAQDLFSVDNLAMLSNVIRTKIDADECSMPVFQKHPMAMRYPLGSAQRRIWAILSAHPNKAASFNMPAALCIKGHSSEQLLKAVNCLLARHPILTSQLVDEDGLFWLKKSPEMCIRQVDAVNETEAAVLFQCQDDALQPISLTSERPCQITMYALKNDVQVVFFKIHHIVCDGWSIQLLFSQLMKILNTGHLDSSLTNNTKRDYMDFTLWESKLDYSKYSQSAITYYKEHLYHYNPYPILHDHDLNLMRIDTAKRVPLMPLSGVDISALKSQLSQAGYRLSNYLLAAFIAGLHILSGSNDMTVALPLAGRSLSGTDDIVGLFVNNGLLRVNLSEDSSFEDCLRQTEINLSELMRYQHVPFDKVVEVISPVDMSNADNNLYQVVFNMTIPLKERLYENIQLLPFDTYIPKSDLKLEITSIDNTIEGYFEYDSNFFEGDTISLLSNYVTRIIQNCWRNLSVSLWDAIEEEESIT